MEPVRVGVIGCGVIAQFHLKGATTSPLIHVEAVADIREESARATAAAFNIPKAYASAEQLIADPAVEAVVLALPAAGRTALALRAFANGKHVLTEKPVAMNAQEVKQLIVARGKLAGGCCSSRLRFLASAEATAKFIASGALGAIRVVQCRCLVADRGRPAAMPPAWRLARSINGGGILVNWGCYDLDYLLGLCGWTLKPRTVLAQDWTIPETFKSHAAPGSDAETHFVAMIRCEGGTAISFERGEYCAAPPENSWQIIGDRGSLRLSMMASKEKRVVFQRADAEAGIAPETVWEGADDLEIQNLAPVRDFAAAIREGRPPRTSLENALVVQQITDAIYASSASGSAVEIH